MMERRKRAAGDFTAISAAAEPGSKKNAQGVPRIPAESPGTQSHNLISRKSFRKATRFLLLTSSEIHQISLNQSNNNSAD
ncbi:MAG: hypothetical protein WDN66_02380, partial [Candidatus Saccharibacteria bacterium]